MSKFTFGADPEIFLKKSGKPFSAYGVLEGTKESPFPVEAGAYQVDGMAAEFNIQPTDYNSFETFNYNIIKVMKQLSQAVKAVDKSITLNISPTQDFDEEFLKAQPEKATELGCDPDFNAYTLEENPVPDATKTFRTGAGHLHIGWGEDIPVDNEDHFKICADFVKNLDATVGLFMTVIDDDSRRRDLYGKAGAFRPKPYGVEYRTPSNVWIRNQEYRFFVWLLMNKAIANTSSGRLGANFNTVNNVEEVINTGDRQKAYNLLMGMPLAGRYQDRLKQIYKQATNSGEKSNA